MRYIIEFETESPDGAGEIWNGEVTIEAVSLSVAYNKVRDRIEELGDGVAIINVIKLEEEEPDTEITIGEVPGAR